MSWDAVGAIGQVLGSVAVFITIGYLAVQVRHAREEARRSAVRARADALRELSTARMDTRVIDARAKAMDASGQQPIGGFVSELMTKGLTREEAYILVQDELAAWNSRWPTVEFANDLQAAERFELDRGLRFAYGSGVSALWYRNARHVLNTNAVRYIDGLLAQSSSPPTPNQQAEGMR